MKRQNGITLIALVITIIVLLILAGVSISAALGNNGILTRAEGAVDTYKEAERNEIAELQKAEDYMNRYGTGGTTPSTPTEPDDTTPGISASGIAPEDYGKQVTGYTLDNYNGTWEILYADDSNIYLITTNVVADPIYNAKNMNGAVNAGTYATGSSLLTTNPTQYPAANKWFRGWLDSSFATAGSTKSNMQATLFMLDSTNVWNGTYRNATYADWAIGSPTYELLAESVNDVQGTTYAPVAESATGYASGTILSGLTQGTVWNRNEYYWLASPSSAYYDMVCLVYFDSEHVSDYYYDRDDFADGFRPVVCLNSSVQLEEGTDGTTYAIKK